MLKLAEDEPKMDYKEFDLPLFADKLISIEYRASINDIEGEEPIINNYNFFSPIEYTIENRRNEIYFLTPSVFTLSEEPMDCGIEFTIKYVKAIHFFKVGITTIETFNRLLEDIMFKIPFDHISERYWKYQYKIMRGFLERMYLKNDDELTKIESNLLCQGDFSSGMDIIALEMLKQKKLHFPQCFEFIEIPFELEVSNKKPTLNGLEEGTPEYEALLGSILNH